MGGIVRTWNVFHGRTVPATRTPRLEQMVRLMAAGAPLVVGMQELPLWSLPLLGGWSGMRVDAAATKPALLGSLAGPLQRLDARLVRSFFTGQANAVLVRRDVEVASADVHVLPRGGERRLCQLLRLRVGPSELTVAHVHLAKERSAARRQLETVARLVGDRAPALVLGDTNLPETGLPGFSAPLPGVDQILVRGVEVTSGPARWREARRDAGGLLLSDHAPVESEIIWP